MSPDSPTPQAIPITFTGPLTLENQRGVETAICRGVQEGEQRFRRAQVRRDTSASGEAHISPRRQELRIGDDIVRVGPTPVSPVFSLSRDLPQWVRAGGHLEIETGNPVRAVYWGRYLFGERGFVVLAKPHEPGRLLVRALTTTLHAKDFGDFAPAISHEPGGEGRSVSAPAYGATFVTDPENQPLIISTAEGVRLYRRNVAASPTAWAGDNVERWLADPKDQGALDESTARKVLQQLTFDNRDDLSIAHFLVALDRSMFASMSVWERRRYLLALINVAEAVGTGIDTDQLDAAMVELLASCESKSELDDLLAPLAVDGKLLRLFSQFDKPTFRLLLAVGSHLAVTPLEPAQLLDIVVYQLKNPLSMFDIGEFIGTTYDWLRSTVSGLADLPLLPVELGGSVAKLVELYVLVAKALGVLPIPIPVLAPVPLPPDPEAMAKLRALLASAGSTGRMAMLGLNHIEELAGAGGAVTSALMRRVLRVVLLEILAAFLTGLPEARAAKIAERVAAQTRLFEALATAVKLADAGEVGRLMWLLPKSYSDDVVRLLKNAPVRSKKLTRFMAVSPEAKQSGQRVVSALRIAEEVERAVGLATGLAEDVVAGVHRILELVGTAPNWTGDVARALLKGMPGTEMSALLRVAGRLTAQQLRELGPVTFTRVARGRGALEFVVDAGAHALAPTAREFGSTTARFEHFLGRVAEARKTLGPQQYHELLMQLAAGELAGFADGERLSEAAAAAEHALQMNPRQIVAAESLGKLGIASTREAFRSAVERKLAKEPGHPLRFLLDENGKLHSKYGDYLYWFEHPEQIEAWHTTSAKALTETGTDRFAVSSTHVNRWDAGTIEHPSIGGYMSSNRVLEIGGIPVEPRTAVDWVSKGLLDPDVLARARWVEFRMVGEEIVSTPVTSAVTSVAGPSEAAEDLGQVTESLLRQLWKEPDE
ncbi:hypothetical protein [Nocardia sp. CA-120079]|uniref:hypothetical protein n=1 Tax=Nocardia sp. CA-120079 TaxID=3239974 RepID=UPI003D98F88F